MSGCSLAFLTKSFDQDDQTDTHWQQPAATDDLYRDHQMTPMLDHPPVETQAPVTPQPQTAVQTAPSRGLNLEQYLHNGSRDVEDRITRLETALIAVHNELKAMNSAAATAGRTSGGNVYPPQTVPSYTPEFADVLNAATQRPASVAPSSAYQTHTPTMTKSAARPATKPKTAQTQKTVNKKAAPIPRGDGIHNVRFGEHKGGITRLVLDSEKALSFSYDLDNTEKLLVITLNGAAWTAKDADSIRKSKMVTSYSANTAGNMTTLVLQLKRPAKITKTLALKPNTDSKSHRIVFDISPQ